VFCINELHRLPGVIYVGVLSLPDTHRLIAESFALVNSSLSEGVATAVLEVRVLSLKHIVISEMDIYSEVSGYCTATTLVYVEEHALRWCQHIITGNRNILANV